MRAIDEIKIAYENGDSIEKIKREFILVKRWFLWVNVIGQNNDIFIIGKKNILKKLKKDLETIYEEFREKIKEIEKSDYDNEKILNAEEEFSYKVDMIIQFYRDISDIEVFAESSRDYFKINEDLIIAKGNNNIYLAEWFSDINLY